jgi:dolichol-phosphate mannosyltransferase
LLLGVPVRDATGGFRIYRRRVLEGIDLATVASAGYCFQVDLLWRAWQAGFQVVEVPIRFVERVSGVSKMNRAIVAEALFKVTVWGLSQRRGRGRRTLARSGNTPSTSGRG